MRSPTCSRASPAARRASSAASCPRPWSTRPRRSGHSS
jgi:hypothetical protein